MMPNSMPMFQATEGLEYNPTDVEEWKKKIYGLEYYDDTIRATTPIWNQSHVDNENQNLNRNHAISEKSTFHNFSSKHIRWQLQRLVHGGTGSTNTNYNSDNPNTTNDKYFDSNIAAITESWDLEDGIVSIHHNSEYQNQQKSSRRLLFEKYYQKRRDIIWIVVLALCATGAAILAVRMVVRTDYSDDTTGYINNNNNQNTNTNHHHHGNSSNDQQQQQQTPNDNPFETKTASSIQENNGNNLFETKTVEVIARTPAPKKHGGYRRRIMLRETERALFGFGKEETFETTAEAQPQFLRNQPTPALN